jgi:hypothetical protein
MVDTTGSTPHIVNGPLTAGVIPWGYGYYTYKNLSAGASSAIEKYLDGQAQIHLTLNNLDGSEMVFVMDPEKDYAVTSYIINGFDVIFFKQYGNYRWVSGNWVPSIVSTELHDKLLAYDIWNFTRISGVPPVPWSFNVEYEADALIEYRSCVTDKPAMYRYSHTVDTDMLLAKRLAFAASEGTQAQNCATAALKYAASQLGKNVTDQQLAQLVYKPDTTTNLFAMKQFAQDLGLHCRAVKLDKKNLKNLDGCEVIQHIPKKNHFVVLGDIDDEYVYSIDLANDNFYYRADLRCGMDWTKGTALLVSNTPIAGKFDDIDDGELRTIIGGSGYSCTNLLQEYDVEYCDYVGGDCGGSYVEYYERWGCEAAESGSCSSSRMISSEESPCIVDPYWPWGCTITGEWTCYYMRACN